MRRYSSSIVSRGDVWAVGSTRRFASKCDEIWSVGSLLITPFGLDQRFILKWRVPSFCRGFLRSVSISSGKRRGFSLFCHYSLFTPKFQFFLTSQIKFCSRGSRIKRLFASELQTSSSPILLLVSDLYSLGCLFTHFYFVFVWVYLDLVS
jgi:hypothetical protein